MRVACSKDEPSQLYFSPENKKKRSSGGSDLYLSSVGDSLSVDRVRNIHGEASRSLGDLEVILHKRKLHTETKPERK